METNMNNKENENRINKVLSSFNKLVEYNSVFNEEDFLTNYSVEELDKFQKKAVKAEFEFLDILKNYSKEKGLSFSNLYSDILFSKVSEEEAVFLYDLFCRSASFEKKTNKKISLIYYFSISYWNDIKSINDNLDNNLTINSNESIRNSMLKAFQIYLSENKMNNITLKLLDPLHGEIFDQIVFKNKLSCLNWEKTVAEEDYNVAKFVAIDNTASYQNIIIPVVVEVNEEDYINLLHIDEIIKIKDVSEIIVEQDMFKVSVKLSSFVGLNNIVDLNNKSKFYFWLNSVLSISLEENKFDRRDGFLHFIMDDDKNIVYAHAGIEFYQNGSVCYKLKAGMEIADFEDVTDLIRDWNIMILNQATMFYDSLTVTYGTKDDLGEEDYQNLFNYIEKIHNKKITIN